MYPASPRQSIECMFVERQCACWHVLPLQRPLNVGNKAATQVQGCTPQKASSRLQHFGPICLHAGGQRRRYHEDYIYQGVCHIAQAAQLRELEQSKRIACVAAVCCIAVRTMTVAASCNLRGCCTQGLAGNVDQDPVLRR